MHDRHLGSSLVYDATIKGRDGRTDEEFLAMRVVDLGRRTYLAAVYPFKSVSGIAVPQMVTMHIYPYYFGQNLKDHVFLGD